MIKKLSIFFIGLAFYLWPITAHAVDVAQDVYKAKISGIYQIRVIDVATGNKAVIGSGFQFTADGYVATNYHVVSEAIHQPNQYRVEYITSNNKTFDLKVVDFDIIHDIAVLKTAQPAAIFLSLDKSVDLSNGTKIFSIGNPYDLGMTIVEGIYNGLMEKSFYKKILFSGSLNSGMSGGPAVNNLGDVVGINVATRGNAISFLVPVEYLKSLYEEVKKDLPVSPDLPPDLSKRIEHQLSDNQDNIFKKILGSPWKQMHIGGALVPAEISPSFKCWGNSEPAPDHIYELTHLTCSTEDQIFVSSSLNTGYIGYRYYWINSLKLNPFRFYSAYERMFAGQKGYESAGENDAENFICNTSFVNVGGKDVKVALCARRYKKYPSLFDMDLALASVFEKTRGLQVKVTALGITQDNIKALTKKFLESISWQK
ncbi:MAG: trypsin-like peptidase domain-containing protein [Candidatus Omnitrophica bacterium]|nr:trypsin-like peptidase domain-containing protein [Candidatus Omnitrophota bacterium]